MNIEIIRDNISIAAIEVDTSIYPRTEVDAKRVTRFVELLQDGILFEPIEIESHPDKDNCYRILDGAHRYKAYKEIGYTNLECHIVNLDGQKPLLYAATKAIGPKNLAEKEQGEVARRVYQADPTLSMTEIAQAIGVSRNRVKEFIADLMAAFETERDVKILKMCLLGIPSGRAAKHLGLSDQTILNYSQNLHSSAFLGNASEDPTDTPDEESTSLSDMIASVKADLNRGYPVVNVAEKHQWPEPLVWAIALDGKDDHERFKQLKWGLRTWDNWYFNDCDLRFGDDWPGRIPAQLVAHTLYFYTRPGELVFDPMAGGGVVADVCLIFGRRCWAFDMTTSKSRPEIEPFTWSLTDLAWPINGKSKPDLIFFDPPYYKKKEAEYAEKAEESGGVSISNLSRNEYLAWFAEFFALAYKQSKSTTRLAFLMADWRDFQGKSAMEEDTSESITSFNYTQLIMAAGWEQPVCISCPLSSERLSGKSVDAMQAKRELGTTNRSLLISKRRNKK